MGPYPQLETNIAMEVQLQILYRLREAEHLKGSAGKNLSQMVCLKLPLLKVTILLQ